MPAIVNKTADYSASFVDFEPPIDMANVPGFFILGVSASRTVKNWGSGGDAQLVGVPTYGAQYARFTGPGAYLQTTIAQQLQQSFAVVARATVGSPAGTVRPCYLSNAVAGGKGTTLYVTSGPGDGMAVSDGAGNTGAISLPRADNDVPTFWAGQQKLDAGGVAPYARLRNYTKGTNQTTAGLPALTTDAKTFRIGMNYDVNLFGPADMALIVIANKLFTDAEETALYTWAQKLMNLRGVAI